MIEPTVSIGRSLVIGAAALVAALLLFPFDSAAAVTISGTMKRTYPADQSGNVPVEGPGSPAPACASNSPTQTTAVRYATVQIRSSSNAILATTFTDAAGHFTVSVPALTAGSPFNLVVLAQTAVAEVYDYISGNLVGVQFAFSSSQATTTLATITINDTADTNAPNIRPALFVLDNIIKAHSYAAARGTTLPQVDVYINANGTYYNPVNTRIYMESKELWHDVEVHEYGHYINDLMGVSRGPAGLNKHQVCEQFDSEPAGAFGEGWANYIMMGVTQHSTPFFYGRWCSAESGPCPTKAQNIEGNVAAVLWDLHDPGNESFDVIASEAQRVWNVMEGFEVNPTLGEFMAVYNDARANPIECQYTGAKCAPDTTRPTVTITTPTSQPTSNTNSSTVALGGTASDNVAVTQITWVNSRGGSGTATGKTTWTASVSGLQSGTNVLTVTARDAAGNTGIDQITVTYALPDTTNPTVTITTPTSQPTSNTNSSTVALGGTASDNVTVTQITWVNSRGGSGTASGTTTWTASVGGLQSGSNVLTVTARDGAGNTGTDQITVTYTPTDATNPTVTITTPTSQPTSNTNSSTVALGGTASDNVGVAQVTWVNNRGGSGTASGTTTWTASVSGLQTGSNALTVTARDAFGNAGTDQITVTYTPTDATNPTVTITTPTSQPTSNTTSSAVSLGGTASDNVAVTQVTWVNNRGGSGAANGTTTWTANVSGLQTGSNVLTVTARDAVGNTGTDQITVTYSPSDTTNPSLTITTPTLQPTTGTNSSTISLGGTASDNVAVTQVTWVNNRGGSGTASGTTTWTASVSGLQSGSNVLNVTAGDAVGNTGNDQITVNYTPVAQQAPTVATNVATNVGQTGARFSTTVNPNGDSTTLSFDYGYTTSYGTTVTYGDIGSGTTATTRAYSISGLSCGTTYHYEARAENSGGSAGGGNQSFSTSDCSQQPEPTVITNPATNVEQIDATLSATVNANGDSTTLYFDYGLTTSYGTTVTYGDIGSATTATTRPYHIGGLSCGTTYHYQARAENSGGFGSGSNESFTTSACAGSDAAYDEILHVPKCAQVAATCDSGALLLGRGDNGPEIHQPNTILASCADGTDGTFHVDESNDRIRVSTLDGALFAPGKTVKIEATVWAYSSPADDRLDLYYAANAASPTWTFLTTLTPSTDGAQTLSATYVLPSGPLQAVRARFRYQGSPSACATGGFDDHDDLVFAVGGTQQTPTVTTNVAATMGQTAATLSATVNPNGDNTTLYFDYGLTTSSATTATYGDIGSGTTAVTQTYSLSGLSCGTTYQYQARAQNSGGAASGGIQSFTTSACTGSNAAYDEILHVPKCAQVAATCDSGPSLLLGRGGQGPEIHQPNTILASCADGTGGTFHVDESNDRIRVSTLDAGSFAPGKTVKIEATVWAYSTPTDDYLDLYYTSNAASPTWTFLTTLTPTAEGAQILSATYVLPSGGLQAVRARFRYQGSPSACATGAYDDYDDLVFAVGGAQAPTVTITIPTSQSTYSTSSDSVALGGTASDDVAVTQVTWVNNRGGTGTASGTTNWTATVPGLQSGDNVITVTALDSGGNMGSDQLTVSYTVPTGNAVYDALLKAPICAQVGSVCDSGTLVSGRDGLPGGSEPHQPNTILASCADGTGGTFHLDESNDRIRVSTLDAGSFAPGKTVKIEATVWAYSTPTDDYLDLYYTSNAASPTWTFLTTLTPTAEGAQILSATYVLPSGGLQAVRARFRYQGSPSACATGAYDDYDDLVFAVGGAAQAPTVTITIPTSQSTYSTSSDSVALGGTASDDVAVTQVTWVNNRGGTGTASGTTNWTATVPGLQSGDNVITVTALDSGGNTGSDQLTVSYTGPTGNAVYDALLKAPICAQVGSVCDSGTLLSGRDGLPGGSEPHQPNTLLASCADGTDGTFHLDESSERIRISTVEGGPFAPGKTVKIEATVWAYSPPTDDRLDLYYASSAASPTWILLTTMTPSTDGPETLSATYVLPAGGLQAVRARFRYQGSASACATGAYDDHDDLAFAVGGAQQPPTVTTDAATNIGQTGATLSATVNPHGDSTTLYFDYGLTTSYGTTVSYGDIGSGTTATTRPHTVSGLSCGSTYQYQARAQNSGGSASGGDQAFTTIACSAPLITWVPPSSIVYGTVLGPTQLNATASLAGTFAYTPPTGTVLNAGAAQTLSVTFSPTDGANYATSAKTVTIDVTKATPVTTWANPVGIVYGTTLSATQLNATANIPGTFLYTPAAATVLNAGGGQTLSVTFTPTDGANYTTATKTVTIDVTKATPVTTWANPVGIVYGTTLSATQLNATANLPGTFLYTPVAGTVLNAGAGQTLSVTFSPSDSTNYTTATKTITIDVTKATPVVTWANPAGIVYGTTLSATQLNATASIPGAFSYTPAVGTVLNTGAAHTLSVTFSPTDGANYTTAPKTVTIGVTRAAPVVTWANPAGIVYGTTLSATQLNATASVPGAFLYTPAAGTVLNVGAAQTLSVTFSPTDAVNYIAVTKTVTIDVTSAVKVTIAPVPATSTSPFITLTGTGLASDAALDGNPGDTVATVIWSSNRGPSGTAQGTTTWRAEIPVFAGANVITVTATDSAGQRGTATVTVTVPSFVYSLAEGATGPFFTLDLLIGNPNAVAAPTSIQFLKEDGSVVTQNYTLSPTSRTTVSVNSIPGLESGAVSSVITSTNALPLLVERTMSWDAGGYGAHTETAVAGTNLTWYFAEGSQGFFDTYLLLANPNPIANSATVRFMTEAAGTVTKTYALLPNSRTNVYAGAIPELVGKSFGISVTFAQPAAAERAMYFGATPFWSGGHGSAGVNAPATSWYHAEGATGAFFDTYILVSNPNSSPATVSLRFLPDSGAAVTTTLTLDANSRRTIQVASQHPTLAKVAVATQVTSDIPIISERSMYWAGPFTNWYEAHNAFGVTELATKWGLGEGRVGGPRGCETYILLANPGSTAATVTITYLRTNGTTLVRTYTVNPTSRFTVGVNGLVPELVNEDFAAVITSTVPIAVERALYWNAGGLTWAAGTNATAIRLP